MRHRLLVMLISLVIISAGCASAGHDKLSPMPEVNNNTSVINESERDRFQKEYRTACEAGRKERSALRKFPFPYEAMLAISSDIDLTTVREFENYHRFLNTREQTPWGQGLGLDIADSAWMYMGSNYPDRADYEGHGLEYAMSYFQGLDPKVIKDASRIMHYYRAGWIDSLHTYGDFSVMKDQVHFKREHAIEAAKVMNEKGFRPKIWINHGTETNVQNFGAYNPRRIFKYQAGDNPDSPYYHTDITLNNGIKYVWNSVGSDCFAWDDPLFPLELRDGRKVWGFKRYTHDLVKGKYLWTWEAHELPRQITRERLDSIASENKFAVFAQHLGKGTEEFPFNPKDIDALELLKAYQDNRKILVARTARLLDYARIRKYLNYETVAYGEMTYINIKSVEDPVLGAQVPSIEDIRGITFYTEDPEHTTILLNSEPVAADIIQRNERDCKGRSSIGVRWFKEDFTDYTLTYKDNI